MEMDLLLQRLILSVPNVTVHSFVFYNKQPMDCDTLSWLENDYTRPHCILAGDFDP